MISTVFFLNEEKTFVENLSDFGTSGKDGVSSCLGGATRSHIHHYIIL